MNSMSCTKPVPNRGEGDRVAQFRSAVTRRMHANEWAERAGWPSAGGDLLLHHTLCGLAAETDTKEMDNG